LSRPGLDSHGGGFLAITDSDPGQVFLEPANPAHRPKGVLAFLAQDTEKRVFCCGNAAVRKEDQNAAEGTL